jgi:hypothetical protein
MTTQPSPRPLLVFEGADIRVVLLVLGRYAGETLSERDHLDAELVVETSFVTGRQSLVLTPADLDAWATCLDALSQGVDEVSWLDDGRSPGVSILRSKAPDVLDGPDGEEAAIQVTAHNAAVDVLVSAWLVPHLGWVRDLKGRLADVRTAWPRQERVSEHTYQWRNA